MTENRWLPYLLDDVYVTCSLGHAVGRSDVGFILGLGWDRWDRNGSLCTL